MTIIDLKLKLYLFAGCSWKIIVKLNIIIHVLAIY